MPLPVISQRSGGNAPSFHLIINIPRGCKLAIDLLMLKGSKVFPGIRCLDRQSGDHTGEGVRFFHLFLAKNAG